MWKAVLTMKTLVVMGILALKKPGLPGSRIAKGVASIAHVEDAPFSVAIATRRFINLFPYCTGTIIDPEWVLTAAHCLIKDPEELSKILIVAGSDDASEFWVLLTKDWVQVRPAKKAYIHPQYWTGITLVGRYDVAVIQVDKFKFDGHVNKAELWARPWVPPPPRAEVEYGTLDCDAYGWGNITSDQLGKDKFKQHLLTAPVQAVHGKKACPLQQMFRNRRIICCLERALCPGDTGGPLVWNNTVVGVAHLTWPNDGVTPGDCNSESVYSIWIYICPVLDFVHKHVPSVPAKPESCSSPHFPATCIVVVIGLCYVTALAYF